MEQRKWHFPQSTKNQPANSINWLLQATPAAIFVASDVQKAAKGHGCPQGEGGLGLKGAVPLAQCEGLILQAVLEVELQVALMPLLQHLLLPPGLPAL